MANPRLEAMRRKVQNGEVPGVDPAPEEKTGGPADAKASIEGPRDQSRDTMRRALAGLVGMVGMVLCGRADVPPLTRDEISAIADAGMDCADAWGVNLGDARIWSTVALIGTIGAAAVPRAVLIAQRQECDVTEPKPEPEPSTEAPTKPEPTGAESYEGA